MQIQTFAAIDIGSYEIEMKIFELSKPRGIREIDCIRHRVELGKDTYNTGKISTEKMDDLCTVLQSFVTIMQGYRVDTYRACATSAIRESKNRLIILDYIERRTGLKVEVLNNAAQRFLDYKSIASRENEFNSIIQQPTAIVDIGGGSIQISLFNKDSLITTQNIRIGTLRLRELLTKMERNSSNYERLTEELVNAELQTYKKLYLKDREIRNLIVVDDHVGELTKKTALSGKEFMQIYKEVINCSTDEIAERFEVPAENVSLIMPSMVIYKCFLEETGADTLWMPGMSLNDGMAYEQAQKIKVLRAGHNFDEDIIAAARNMAKRYQSSKSHIKALEDMALLLYDRTKKLHGLGQRERLLLQIATILHSCGKYISLLNVAECSYNIIMATEIIGLTKTEREIIANVVRYNTAEFKYYEEVAASSSLTKEEHLIVAKLTAILRLVNVMDRSHKQKFGDVRITLKEKELVITVRTAEDTTLERGLFPAKAELFEEVFSLRPVIRQVKPS